MTAKRKQPLDFILGHANQWYVPVVDALLKQGAPVISRGRAVHESLHTALQLAESRRRVVTVPYRRANPFFQAAETVWILAGRADAQWILRYNSQLRQYLDTAVPRPSQFHGAYGERLRRWDHISQLEEPPGPEVDQLRHVLDQLRKDPGSRRAVAVLHNPRVDNPWLETLDRPCNIALTYQQRDGALHAATFNRSNDVTLGLSYTNLVQFTTIQEFLAAALGLQPGKYTHFSSSLHLYDDDVIARRCLEAFTKHHRFDVYHHAHPTPMKRWDTPNEGFDVVERLTGQDCPQLECPYWESVRLLLRAWDTLKRDQDPSTVVEMAAKMLLAMAAQDWMIAALEFLYRWARRRQVLDPFLAVVGTGKFPAEVLAYIQHDDGLDPTAPEV